MKEIIHVFPQIALAIGVLTPNRRGGGHELWRGSRWVPLLGAIAGCHCWVPLWWCHGCHCWVPLWWCHCWVRLLGAIAGCDCWVPLLGCHGWVRVPLLGCHCWVPLWRAIAGCHCGVPLLDASYQRWRSSRWVPVLGVIAGYHVGVPFLGAIAGVPFREKIDKSITPFSYRTFLYIDNTQIG